ncbi:hypothetical protein [Rhodococcus sp. NPDC058521]|uniref:hypothetical protein n=1 Tax=Rhodococcus sp. NPDC058521 TaxID=3346536 RepID=UPI00365537F5
MSTTDRTGRAMRRAMIVPLAASVLAVAGCAASVAGTPVAQQGVTKSTAPSPGSAPAPASGKAVDCDALTKALGPLVSDRPEVSEQKLPGMNDPMCMWTKGPSNIADAVTVIVREEAHDPAVIAQMHTVGTTVPDPRADALGGVVLDVVGLALLTPTHNIITNSMDTAVDDAKKLDLLFAVAEYLEK